MRKIDIFIFLLFAVMASWQDIRYRGVAIWLFAGFGVIALAYGFAEGMVPVCLCGTLVGFVLLFISRLTRGAIGSGDAWFFVVSGLLLPLKINFLILCTSVFMSGIFSLILFTAYRIKNRLDAGAFTLPFIPFAAAAGLLAVITRPM